MYLQTSVFLLKYTNLPQSHTCSIQMIFILTCTAYTSRAHSHIEDTHHMNSQTHTHTQHLHHLKTRHNNQRHEKMSADEHLFVIKKKQMICVGGCCAVLSVPLLWAGLRSAQCSVSLCCGRGYAVRSVQCPSVEGGATQCSISLRVLLWCEPADRKQLLRAVAQHLIELTDKPVHVSLAGRLVNDVLVIVVSHTAWQFLVIHLGLVLAHAPPPCDFVRVGHLELPSVPRPCYQVLAGLVRQQLKQKLP